MANSNVGNSAQGHELDLANVKHHTGRIEIKRNMISTVIECLAINCRRRSACSRLVGWLSPIRGRVGVGPRAEQVILPNIQQPDRTRRY